MDYLLIYMRRIDCIYKLKLQEPGAEFRWEQMEEIRLGLEKDLDVSVYANPSIKWEEMKRIREELTMYKQEI